MEIVVIGAILGAMVGALYNIGNSLSKIRKELERIRIVAEEKNKDQ